jgi:3-hydroxyisobutyrate dehydrogenase-like beta-hydroxyacid dehydrogenase
MAALQADGTFGSGVGVGLLPVISQASTLHKPTIAIMSFGEMGFGVATVLLKYSYPVITNLDGRSANTKTRVEALGVKDLPFKTMLEEASIVLSIVPPAEAFSLAQLTAAAVQTSNEQKDKLVYMDLNAVSPALSRQMAEVVNAAGMTFIDGAILGFPPRELVDGTWFRPAITISGPQLSSINAPWTEELSLLLNLRHVGDEVGAASGLKMCFGAIYKGQAAIGIQAYTTAQAIGVLPALRSHLAEYFPSTTPILESSLIGSQRKAYRWIKEMEEIEETFEKEGGWSRGLFQNVSNVFRVVAQQTELGTNAKADVESVMSEVCSALKRRKSV